MSGADPGDANLTWTVCSASGAEAWVSMLNHGGQFHAEAICKGLGYTRLGVHGGTCGTVCDEGGACWNGVCGEGPCEPGRAECDGDASNGCETVTQDDPQNCGKCHLACASNFCAGGRCTTMECASGTADCNGEESDHCETDLTTVADCGMCDAKCSDVHGKPSCSQDGCGIECDDGYENCDEGRKRLRNRPSKRRAALRRLRHRVWQRARNDQVRGRRVSAALRGRLRRL